MKQKTVAVFGKVPPFERINRGRRDQRSLAAVHRPRFRAAQNLVLIVVPSGIRARAASVYLRILLEVHEMRASLRSTSRKHTRSLNHSTSGATV